VSVSVFIFCAPELVFGGIESVGSRFHVLRSRTRFGGYRGRQVSFSCFALSDLFSAVPRERGLVFFVLHSRTRFGRYRGRGVLFSCFALLDSFSAIMRALCHVFMFCAPEPVLGDIVGVESNFHVLRSQTRFGPYRGHRGLFLCLRFRTHFRQYRGRQVPFSRFALPDLFSMVPRASGPIFMFCAFGLVSDGTEGDGSRFHVLHSRNRFCWYRGRQVSFSCFALLNLFSAVPRALCPIFMFCAPGPISGGTEGDGSRFHVL
jgi:hypothetical protein